MPPPAPCPLPPAPAVSRSGSVTSTSARRSRSGARRNQGRSGRDFALSARKRRAHIYDQSRRADLIYSSFSSRVAVRDDTGQDVTRRDCLRGVTMEQEGLATGTRRAAFYYRFYGRSRGARLLVSFDLSQVTC
jgi:hypothetical protein